MTDERHYTLQELADHWSVSHEWVRRRFKREPGVVKLGASWRVPASVADRVYAHSQISACPRLPKFRAKRTRDGSVEHVPK